MPRQRGAVSGMWVGVGRPVACWACCKGVKQQVGAGEEGAGSAGTQPVSKSVIGSVVHTCCGGGPPALASVNRRLGGGGCSSGCRGGGGPPGGGGYAP